MPLQSGETHDQGHQDQTSPSSCDSISCRSNIVSESSDDRVGGSDRKDEVDGLDDMCKEIESLEKELEHISKEYGSIKEEAQKLEGNTFVQFEGYESFPDMAAEECITKQEEYTQRREEQRRRFEDVFLRLEEAEQKKIELDKRKIGAIRKTTELKMRASNLRETILWQYQRKDSDSHID
ncbi:uncharacterized protein FOMMEDRAFT_153649 [Fomitiporia mediterranea MF3/22]|uniref:uncharacterized protein n=1 Tax=Fomitiporia mediterranea (strain MF3/22) TaxID=694068 RepID=UPI000440908B|nr:uncharacterized protein FOMMEDRAFT_153649 [Fomitiporia mediterranea MF3/22]EJD06249.1 hypothetical protein FOMMEDRAFT_153649 [Fomitiporia mediterranea MF3/22]